MGGAADGAEGAEQGGPSDGRAVSGMLAPPGASDTIADPIADEGAVGAVLDSVRTFRHNYWAPLLLGLAMLFDSWDAIAVAFAMPTLSSDWHLNPLAMGYVIAASYGGQFIGALVLGAVAERLGRMPVLIFAIAIMGLLAIGCAMAPDYRTLLVLRFVQGLMVGGASPVAITYINELAPTHRRGFYFGMYQMLALGGLAIASLSSPYIIGHLGWRWMFGLGAGSVLLLPLVWATLPESPRWLARTGRREAANKALARLGGAPAAFAASGAASGGAAMGGASPVPVARPTKTLILFSAEFRTRTLTTTLLWFMTMFVSIGVTTWLPSIFVKVLHIPVHRSLVYAAVTSCLMEAFVPLSGVLVDRFGRRSMGWTTMLVTGVPLIGLALYLPASELVLVVLVAISQLANLIGAFALWPYTAETYRTDVRALALGYASAVGRFSSVVTPIFVGFVLNEGGSIGIVFAGFGLCALAASATWLLRTRETRGIRLEQV